MVISLLKIPTTQDRRAELLEILRSVQEPVRIRPGCASFDIYEESGPEQSLIVLERWTDHEALEEHIRSEAYRRILGAIELSSGPPEVYFERVVESEGMELIEHLRNI